jgi:hypothetical protein
LNTKSFQYQLKIATNVTLSSWQNQHFNDFILANFRGQPPYPILKDLSTDELEYITRWLDHYHVGPDPTNPRPIVGFLKEFKDQQDSGTSTFKLPEVPQ